MEETSPECDPSVSQLCRWDELGGYCCHRRSPGCRFVPMRETHSVYADQVKLPSGVGRGTTPPGRQRDRQSVLGCSTSISASTSYGPVGIRHEDGIPEGWEAPEGYLQVWSRSPQRSSRVLTTSETTTQDGGGSCSIRVARCLSCAGTEASWALPPLRRARAGNKEITV